MELTPFRLHEALKTYFPDPIVHDPLDPFSHPKYKVNYDARALERKSFQLYRRLYSKEVDPDLALRSVVLEHSWAGQEFSRMVFHCVSFGADVNRPFHTNSGKAVSGYSSPVHQEKSLLDCLLDLGFYRVIMRLLHLRLVVMLGSGSRPDESTQMVCGLPSDIWIMIFSRLPLADLAHMRLLCRGLRDVASRPHAWKTAVLVPKSQHLASLIRANRGDIAALFLRTPGLHIRDATPERDVLAAACKNSELRVVQSVVSMYPDTILDNRVAIRYASDCGFSQICEMICCAGVKRSEAGWIPNEDVEAAARGGLKWIENVSYQRLIVDAYGSEGNTNLDGAMHSWTVLGSLLIGVLGEKSSRPSIGMVDMRSGTMVRRLFRERPTFKLPSWGDMQMDYGFHGVRNRGRITVTSPRDGAIYYVANACILEEWHVTKWSFERAVNVGFRVWKMCFCCGFILILGFTRYAIIQAENLAVVAVHAYKLTLSQEFRVAQCAVTAGENCFYFGLLASGREKFFEELSDEEMPQVIERQLYATLFEVSCKGGGFVAMPRWQRDNLAPIHLGGRMSISSNDTHVAIGIGSAAMIVSIGPWLEVTQISEDDGDYEVTALAMCSSGVVIGFGREEDNERDAEGNLECDDSWEPAIEAVRVVQDQTGIADEVEVVRVSVGDEVPKFAATCIDQCENSKDNGCSYNLMDIVGDTLLLRSHRCGQLSLVRVNKSDFAI